MTTWETIALARVMSRAGIPVPILQRELEGDMIPDPDHKAAVL